MRIELEMWFSLTIIKMHFLHTWWYFSLTVTQQEVIMETIRYKFEKKKKRKKEATPWSKVGDQLIFYLKTKVGH